MTLSATHTPTITVTIGYTHVLQPDGTIPMVKGYAPGMTQAFATVDIPVPEIAMGDKFFDEVAERLYAATNTYGSLFPEVWAVTEPALPPFTIDVESAASRGERDHTALSVGDTITFEGKILSCEHVGWKEVTP
jgi:hypothetical protein